MKQSGIWVLKVRVGATRSTLPDIVENGQERINTTRGTLFSSWIWERSHSWLLKKSPWNTNKSLKFKTPALWLRSWETWRTDRGSRTQGNIAAWNIWAWAASRVESSGAITKIKASQSIARGKGCLFSSRAKSRRYQRKAKKEVNKTEINQLRTQFLPACWW